MEASELDFEAAHKFFAIGAFISLFQENSKEVVEELLELYTDEARKLRLMLNGKSPGPIARLLQAYNAEGE